MQRDYVQAYMWLGLAISSLREGDANVREMVIQDMNKLKLTMTPEQQAEAQRLIQEWKPR